MSIRRLLVGALLVACAVVSGSAAAVGWWRIVDGDRNTIVGPPSGEASFTGFGCELVLVNTNYVVACSSNANMYFQSPWSTISPTGARGCVSMTYPITEPPNGANCYTSSYNINQIPPIPPGLYPQCADGQPTTAEVPCIRPFKFSAAPTAPGGTVVSHWEINFGSFDGPRSYCVEPDGSLDCTVYPPADGVTYPVPFVTLVYAPDGTPPQVSCAAADAAWHNGDVSISCTADDPESGLADPDDDASFVLATNVTPGSETPNAATNARRVCNTYGACTNAQITGIKVDKKAPAITITSPGANATYQQNAIVGASYACADAGSGVATCQGTAASASPIDTSSAGTKSFTVTSIDSAGNTSTLTRSYEVVKGGGGGAISANLGIQLSAPDRVSAGGTLTYSMKVKNDGKSPATDVVVSDVLPPGTVFASASLSQGVLTAPAVGSNGVVMAYIGNLANHATATIEVTVTVTAAARTVLTNTAIVTGTIQDLGNGNNSDTIKSTVK